MNKKATKFFNYFFLVLIGFLAISNLFVYSYPYFSQGVDLAKISFQNPITIVISLFLFAVILLVFNYLTAKKYMIIILLLVSFSFKVFWIINWPIDNYYDMTSVYTFASDIFTIPDYLPITGFHYLKIYDYNIPLVLIDLLYINIAGLDKVYFLGRIINLICLLLIDFGIYITTLEIFDKKIAIRALFLSVLFFPFTGFISVIYNDINSCMVFIYALYFFIKYIKTFRNKYMFIALAFLIVANTLRSIGIIFFIAFSLYLIFTRLKKAFFFILFGIFIFLISNFSMTSYYGTIGILDSNEKSMSIPITHYLAIGLSNGINGETPGYYSPYLNDYYFKDFNYDSEEFLEISKSNLINNIESIGIDGLPLHYITKYLLQWTDGCFETQLVNSFIPDKSQSPITYENNSNTREFFTDNKLVYGLIIKYSNAYWLMILLSTFVYAFKSIKDGRVTALLKIIIMGVMGFYILWEISPHYSFVALPYFIILSAKGMEIIRKFIRRKYYEIKNI